MLVTVKDLNKTYKNHQVLKDISFVINEREIVGFIGPNGAGKSTTMKCMVDLVIPDSGEINILGYDLFTQREKALENVSSIIENPGLYYNLTGRQNIEIFAKVRKIDKVEVLKVEKFTRLKHELDKKVRDYSMGMKQRLGLGIALLSNPKLLILDEPTNGLDPRAIIELRDTLRYLVENEDISILFSSHQLGEVEKLADRIICIKEGKIIELPTDATQVINYVIQVGSKGHKDVLKIITEYIELDDMEILGEGFFKITISEDKSLSILLRKILNSWDIIGIEKFNTDIESIYREVYGDIDE